MGSLVYLFFFIALVTTKPALYWNFSEGLLMNGDCHLVYDAIEVVKIQKWLNLCYVIIDEVQEEGLSL